MLEGNNMGPGAPRNLPLSPVKAEDYYIELGKQAQKELDEMSILKGKFNLTKNTDFKTSDVHSYLAARTEFLSSLEHYAQNGSTQEVKDRAEEMIVEFSQGPDAEL